MRSKLKLEAGDLSPLVKLFTRHELIHWWRGSVQSILASNASSTFSTFSSIELDSLISTMGHVESTMARRRVKGSFMRGRGRGEWDCNVFDTLYIAQMSLIIRGTGSGSQPDPTRPRTCPHTGRNAWRALRSSGTWKSKNKNNSFRLIKFGSAEDPEHPKFEDQAKYRVMN